MNYIKISKNDIANGEGVRVVLWLSGCSHHCKNCHNQNTWNPNAGQKFDDAAMEELLNALSPDYIRGITFSGGDPLFHANRQEVLQLLNLIRNKYPTKDIWMYSGYTWEEIDAFQEGQQIKHLIDVLVDGKFQQELHSINLKWKGSSNQRVIDVPLSISSNRVVLKT